MTAHVLIVNLGLVPGLPAASLLGTLPGLGRFASSLSDAGARVSVLARAEESAERVEGGVRLVTVHDGDPPLPPLRSASVEVLRLVDRLAPDVVHLGGLLFPVPAVALRTLLPRRVPLLLQHHGEPPGTGRLGALQRVGLRAADGALFTCREAAACWVRAGLLPAGIPVHEVLEASTDLSPVPREEARQSTGVDGDPAVLWVGRLHERKDPATALRLFEAALGRLPSARLHLVYQEAPLLPELRRAVARSGALSASVRFVGPVPHALLPRWYSAADLFVTSSPAEGSNWAFIEATACGLPAVASDIPANRRVGGDGTEFFPAGDAAAGSDALVRASAGPAGRRGPLREHFERRLSWPVVAREALDAYALALAARRR